MADKIIGSLLYDDHPVPKRAGEWKNKLKVPAVIGLLLLLIGGVVYKFVNYREEQKVRNFIGTVRSGQFDAAFQNWNMGGNYRLNDFLQDWGKDGFYTKGMHEARVVDSNSQGTSVIVYLAIDDRTPIALLVDKETLRISFSPVNKYSQ